MTSSIALIHPPVVRPCEPPAGIAKLAGALSRHGSEPLVLDANVEGLLGLLQTPISSQDTWTRRAWRHLSNHLASLHSWEAYHRYGRYTRAIQDLNRVLQVTAQASGVQVSLGNYQDRELSPTKSQDLIRTAEKPEVSPFYPYFRQRLRGLLEKEQPSIAGLSLNYLTQALTTFAMIGFLRREYPRLMCVLGGGLVTSWVRRPGWTNPFGGWVDHLVAGPGEKALLSLMGIERGKGEGHPGEPSSPCYDMFPLGSYLAPGLILPYSASSGCYWSQCAFCPERAEGNPCVPTPPEKVITDLRFLTDRHKPALIHLVDNAVSPALLKKLVESPPHTPWYGFARITRHLSDPDFCFALKKSGCVMLKLGLESGDQGVLDALQKGVDLGVASSVLKSLKQSGIATYVYLLFGTPPESLEEARATLGFVAKHHDLIDFLNVAIFNLPVYGPDTARLETKMFYEGDLSLYVDFDHPRGWNRKMVRQFLDKEFKRHPAIAPILRRDPPVFTSNHAPFLVMSREKDSDQRFDSESVRTR